MNISNLIDDEIELFRTSNEIETDIEYNRRCLLILNLICNNIYEITNGSLYLSGKLPAYPELYKRERWIESNKTLSKLVYDDILIKLEDYIDNNPFSNTDVVDKLYFYGKLIKCIDWSTV